MRNTFKIKIKQKKTMKKINLILLMLISVISYSQTTSTIISAATATVSANYTYSPENGRIGSIQIVTSSDFVGTTGTIALKCSNNDIAFSTVYANDGITPLSFTLTSAATTYIWEFQLVLYKTYQLVYTKGNTSAGTISATILTR